MQKVKDIQSKINFDAIIVLVFVFSYTAPVIATMMKIKSSGIYLASILALIISITYIVVIFLSDLSRNIEIKENFKNVTYEPVQVEDFYSFSINSMCELEHAISRAKESNLHLGIYVSVPNCDYDELIMNHPDNLESKLEYYKNSYNEDLTLKARPSIKMKRCVFPILEK